MLGGDFEPWCLPGEDEIGGLDDLSHDGDDSELWWLAVSLEAVGESFELWIESFGDDRGDVEHASGPGSSACDDALAFVSAGIVVEGCDADEGSGLSFAHGAELGHADEKSGGDDGPTPGRDWRRL
jgi:hypothetical protein